MNRKKKLYQLFDALMVIVSELIVRGGGSRGEAQTTGSYRQRHELEKNLFPRPYEAKKERLTTWGLDEQVKQMTTTTTTTITTLIFLCLHGTSTHNAGFFLRRWWD